MALFASLATFLLAIIGAALLSSSDPVRLDLEPRPDKLEGSSWLHEFSAEDLEKAIVGHGPDDLGVVDSQGRVYAGGDDGWIKRIGVHGTVENHTYVGGQALDVISLGPNEEVYFMDPGGDGLFKVGDDGYVTLLSYEVGGAEILFADGMVVAKDGTVYFTDVSPNVRYTNRILGLIERLPSGRLLKYSPATGSTWVLRKDLGFVNGVALSENEDFLLISEMYRARIMRYWLKGEKKGTLDTFIDGLPAFPDNVRRSESDGNFYIALSRTTATSDWAIKTPAKLSRSLIVDPILSNRANDMRGAMLLVVSPEGKLVSKHKDPTGKGTFVTRARRLDQRKSVSKYSPEGKLASKHEDLTGKGNFVTGGRRLGQGKLVSKYDDPTGHVMDFVTGARRLGEGKSVSNYEDPSGNMMNFVTGGRRLGDSFFSGPWLKFSV